MKITNQVDFLYNALDRPIDTSTKFILCLIRRICKLLTEIFIHHFIRPTNSIIIKSSKTIFVRYLF